MSEGQALEKVSSPQSTSMEIIPPNLTTQMATIVPLDRENLSFFANLVKSCGLIPKVNGVSDEMQFSRVMGKIVAGTSHGFDPFLAQSCFDAGLFGGMPLNAKGQGILFRRTGEYDLQIVEHTDKVCTANILRRYNGTWVPEIRQFTGGEWKKVGVVTFDEAMAKKAGLANKDMYQKYGPDMYYARVVTRAVKRYNPSCLLPIVVLGNHFAKESQPPPAFQPPTPGQNQLGEGDAVPAAKAEEPPVNDSQTIPEADIPDADFEVEGEVQELAQPQEITVEPEPIDSEESKLANLQTVAKELYADLPTDGKKAADKWLGQKMIRDLTVEELTEFIKVHQPV